MQQIHTDKNPNDLNDEIDIREIFYVLLAGKKIIISVTALISVIGVIYSLLLPNIYESKALLVPVSPSSDISRALGGYGAIAGLAGVNIPSGVDEGNSQKAIKKISSLSFFENNILINIFLPNLMAVKSWNSSTNLLVYKEDQYDTQSSTWVRDFAYPQLQIPSAQESYEIFKEEHLSLSEDKNSGFITLSIKHKSPFIARQWTQLIVNEINGFYRLKDKLESEKSVSYLNQQISLTNLSEVKEALAQLLQEQTKKLALIEANQFYVFDYIDPPAVMEEKSEPSRAIICIISAILGGMLSCLWVLIRHYIYKQK
jgi:LPS O-antigen subunit length determinant protein (WzzB/FepE family)